MNKSELRSIRADLRRAIKAIDAALGEQSITTPKVYDVEPNRIDIMEAKMQTRKRLKDAGATTGSESLALSQRLRSKGWIVKQMWIDGVRARYWLSPSDPLNR